jgi:cation transport ATPase
MTLEPVLPIEGEEDNAELKQLSRRFWWSLPLTVIVTVLAMAGHSFSLFHANTQNLVEFLLGTPVVLWAGWPFFSRGLASVRQRNPNMWTLISLSVQRLRNVLAWHVSLHIHEGRTYRRLLRSRRGHHFPYFARANA